jgi:uncharacterized protein (TIGR03086 family)
MSWVQELIERTTDEQHSLPTPCADWSVKELIDHIIELALVSLMTTYTDDPRIAHVFEIREDDPAGAYAAARRLLVDATEDRSVRQNATKMWGAMQPASVRMGGEIINQLVHGWDLAVATGQDPTLPEEVAGPACELSRELIDRAPELRGWYSTEVPVDDSATAGDRLVALLGRDPAIARRSREATPSD